MKSFTFCCHSEFISESSKTGFTLIELLVVVLIIGILASVALPQYQKAVLKSRTAEVWANLKNLNMAANAYCLENPSGSGIYDNDSPANDTLSSVFDIEVQSSKYFLYNGRINCSSSSPIAIGAESKGGLSYFRLWLNPQTGRRSCSDPGNGACQKLGFTKASSSTSICTCGVNCGASSCYYAD